MTPAPEADDFFKKVTADPWFRLGMAMLEQGGPQDRPHSVGQDIARAVEKVQGQMDDDVARSQAREQMARENQMREFMQNQLQGLSGGQMPLAGAFAGPQAGAYAGPQMPAEARPVPQAAFMPPTVAPRIDPVANPSSDIRITRQPTGRLRSSAIDEQITRAAKAAGVDPLLFRSLVQSESNFNHMDPRKGGITTSYAGALGAAQLMPGTARELGVDPMDLEQNLAGGARYLAQQIKANNGDIREALRAYNAGPTGARRNPRLGGDYADTIMGRLPSPISAAAPQSAPAPMPMAPPQSGATQLPPELHRIFLAQAYAEGGGDPTATVRSYYRQLSQWQTQQFTQGGNLSNQRQLEDYKSKLELGRNRQKLKDEVDVADDKKVNEEYGVTIGKRYDQISSAGSSAQAKIDRLNLLQDMLSRGFQGRGGDTAAQLVRIGATLGFEGMNEKASAADVASALINQMALSFRSTASGEGMPGAMSDADRQFLMTLPPGFEKTPAGNRILIEFYKRAAKRDQKIAQMARAYRKKNGSFSDDFEDDIIAYSNANPLFADGEVPEIMGVVPPPQAIQRLRSNPTDEEKSNFQAVFGKRALDRALGGGK